jgi:hypothetical protein
MSDSIIQALLDASPMPGGLRLQAEELARRIVAAVDPAEFDERPLLQFRESQIGEQLAAIWFGGEAGGLAYDFGVLLRQTSARRLEFKVVAIGVKRPRKRGNDER